jgi:hypothetical protein
MVRRFLCAVALATAVPGKSIRGVLVEYGPGGSSPAHTHPNSAFHLCNGLGGGDPKPGQQRTGDNVSRWRKLFRISGRSSWCQRKRKHY